ncbi:MAG TPA: DUF5069 domain-containing protein [Candidatus Cybelea sp.]
MKPLDLTIRPPRSCHAELDGLMLLPRTIDKLRAMLPGGNPGLYFINAEIMGLSGYLLGRLGVSEEELRDAVRDCAGEEDVARWLRDRTDVKAYSAINQTLRRIRPKHAQDEAYFRRQYSETLAQHLELEFIVDIIEADDRRLFSP